MDEAWQRLQLAQRALALGDVYGAARFAKQAEMRFKLGAVRKVPELDPREQRPETPYRDRIQQRTERRRKSGMRDEDQATPLSEVGSGLAAVNRLLAAVESSLPKGAVAPPPVEQDRAAIMGRVRAAGSAEIIAYLPTVEAANNVYFDRLLANLLNGQQGHIYLEDQTFDRGSNQILKISFTIVGSASVCHMFATRRPHFQVVGELTAPAMEVETACASYVELLDRWLNLKAEKEHPTPTA